MLRYGISLGRLGGNDGRGARYPPFARAVQLYSLAEPERHVGSTALMASANYGGGSSGYEIQSYTSVKKPPRSPKTVWREAVGFKKALADELRGGTAVLLRLVQIAIGIIMFLVVMVVILAVVLRQG